MRTAEIDRHIDTLMSPNQATESQDSYELLPDAQIFLSDLVNEIGRATTSVAMQFYTFEADDAGLPVAEALMRAAKSGVPTRIMIDHFINLSHNDSYIHAPRLDRKLHRSIVAEWRATNALIERMKAAGVQVEMINPLGFLHRKVLRRDHKKLVAIDAEDPKKGVSYVGGINPSDHNAGWNDFMVKMRGPMTALARQELDNTWHQRSKGNIRNYPGGLFMTDARGEPVIIPTVRRLIQRAQHSVIMESPYLWGGALLHDLAQAAMSGLDVAVIVPLNNNHRFFIPTDRSLARLAAANVGVYRYEADDGMTHAKGALIDGVSVVGSNNYNQFLSGKVGEVCIATTHPSLREQLEAFLRSDINKSTQQTN